MASRFVLPFADVGSGIKPSSGAQLFFFDTGTSTPRDTFTDSSLSTPNANPVIADSNGVFGDIFLNGAYKVQLKDKNDVQIWEADPVEESSADRQEETTGLSPIVDASVGLDLFPIIGGGLRVGGLDLWMVPATTAAGVAMPNPAILDAIPTTKDVTVNSGTAVTLIDLTSQIPSTDSIASMTLTVGTTYKADRYYAAGEPVPGLVYYNRGQGWPVSADDIIDHGDAAGNFLELITDNLWLHQAGVRTKADDPTGFYTARIQAVQDKHGVCFARRATYRIDSQLTTRATNGNPVSMDWGGSDIEATIDDTTWAYLVQSFDASARAQAKNFNLISIDTKSSAPLEANWKHGLCLGGSNGTLENYRVENFSGFSVALGTETISSTTLPAFTDCFYWECVSGNVASMYGVNLFIGDSNNANNFTTFGCFPFNGFNQSPTRDNNCIREIEIKGKANTFGGAINLEAAPSNEKILFRSEAQSNVFDSLVYMETNSSWDTFAGAALEFETGTSGNRVVGRWSGLQTFATDIGTANEWEQIADFNVNAKVNTNPQTVTNVCHNPDFTNATPFDGWASFSTGASGQTVNSTGGFFTGDSYSETITAGRPNIIYRADGETFNLRGLLSQTITASMMIKSTLPVRLKVNGIGGNTHPANDQWVNITTTGFVDGTDTKVELQIITEASGVTGDVEISNLSAYLGANMYSA